MKTIADFEKLLVIDKHRLDEELVVHSNVMFEITKLMTAQLAKVTTSGDAFKQAEGLAFAAAKEAGASDKLADMQKLQDPARLRAWEIHEYEKYEHAAWEWLFEAWKQKGHSMRELVSLFQAQYWSLEPAAGAKPRRTFGANDTRPADTPRRSSR